MLTAARYRERSLAAEKTLRSAFRFENETAPYLIYDAGYWLFGDVQEHVPLDYCDEDPTSMIRYQEDGIKQHVQHYDDAYIPFLMPWYGTGVLASGFGVNIKFLLASLTISLRSRAASNFARSTMFDTMPPEALTPP